MSTPAPAPPFTPGYAWGSRSDDVFEKLEHIGEGTYGKVYLARDKKTDEKVALKKVRMDNEKEGFPITAIREIKILKHLDHANIVKLKEIVTSKGTEFNKMKGSIYMVFEYMDHDLTGLVDTPGIRFRDPQIKCYMRQLLEGLHYCHKNKILHRDIKGSNLLINNKGELKLADFGLARSFSEQSSNYTNRVITLWYRPPELLLGATAYGPAVDMWSVGCILAELLARRPILPGRNDVEQLEKIWRLCGTPTDETWPKAKELPWWKMFQPQRHIERDVRGAFRDLKPEALDLIDKLLQLDPEKRLSASDALDHDYFWVSPLPLEPKDLPKYDIDCHELQSKKRKQAHRNQSQTKGGGAPALPTSTTSSHTAMNTQDHHHKDKRHRGENYSRGSASTQPPGAALPPLPPPPPPMSHVGRVAHGSAGTNGPAPPPMPPPPPPPDLHYRSAEYSHRSGHGSTYLDSHTAGRHSSYHHSRHHRRE